LQKRTAERACKIFMAKLTAPENLSYTARLRCSQVVKNTRVSSSFVSDRETEKI